MHPICGGGRASLRKHHHSTADADDEADLMPILEDEILNGLESSGLTACHDLSTDERRAVKRKKCSLCLILRVFLVSLLFLISVSLGLFCLYTYMTTCSSPECATSSARLLANMDLDADPCDDFYQYSCGMWINQTVNLNYPSWNTIYKTFMAAHDRTIMTILAASESQLPFQLSEGEKSAVKVFRQCTDGNGQLAIGKKPLIDLMESLGGWMPDLVPKEPQVVAVFDSPRSPMLLMAEETEEEKTARSRREIIDSPLEDELLKCFNLSVFPIFFGGVQVSYVNSSEYIITIYPQVPLLMRSDIYRGPTPTVESILEGTSNSQIAFLLYTVGQEVADILGLESPDLRKRIAEMIVLEWKITNCWPTETELENDLYEVRTLDDLHKISPALDWQYFFSRLTGLSLSRMEPIAFKSGVEWMEKLSVVLEEYTSTVEKQLILRSYLKWKVAMFYISYIKEEHGHPTTWLMTQLLTGPPHLKKEFCFMRLSGIFPLSLPSILRKADGHERVTKNRDAALRMAERIREEYLDMARSTDVLDDYTRNTVRKKLTNMSIKASYPDKVDIPEELGAEADRVGNSLFESMIIGTVAVYRKSIGRLRSPVDQRDWIDTRPALSSVPVLNYERNMVLLPMDILYAPMHDVGQVDSLNYGILGFTIGHEMTHAFDDEGKQHGPTGNLGDRNWWSSSSKQKYRDLEKCVIDHYANFTKNPAMAYKARYETVADLVGVDMAFKAWKRNGQDVWKRLPGLDLSPEQRFFVAYAQGWCAQPTQGNAEKHYSEKPRVLGSLRNSPLFARAFSCKPNTFMNPANKCRIW